MRTELLNYLSDNLTGGIKVSNELPWVQGDNPLYLQNKKRVYLDEPTTEQSSIIPLLNSNDIIQTVTTITGYLAVDAKNRPTDLDSALSTIAVAKDQSGITDSFRKDYSYTATIDRDVITYAFEYKFYTIK